jgi:hypothetical protein
MTKNVKTTCVNENRGLGFSTIFASTDLSEFAKSSDQEAQAVLSNTNAKIFLKLPNSTTEE